MHPVIRICCLVLAAGFLARGGWGEVGALGLLAGAGLWRQGAAPLYPLWRVLRRLRFLWLSIAIAYFWFTPGSRLWPALGVWSPTHQGLAEGALRVAALAVLVLWVQWLMQTTGRAPLIGAIRWWARPLHSFGLDPARLALRLVLALETVPRLHELVAQTRPPLGSKRLQRLGAFAGAVFTATVQAAEGAEPMVVEVPHLGAPPLWQWLLPTVLTVLLIAV